MWPIVATQSAMPLFTWDFVVCQRYSRTAAAQTELLSETAVALLADKGITFPPRYQLNGCWEDAITTWNGNISLKRDTWILSEGGTGFKAW